MIYVYGWCETTIEQINGETPTYLHHDQQGSVRLLTGSAGTTTGSITFNAYGSKVESTGTTSPLGYDGQDTSSDTGFIYMRARVYDPATAQFLTADPITVMTRSPYGYAFDNPVTWSDPTGLIFGIPGTPSWEEVGSTALNTLNGAGKVVAEAAPYAAPVLDVVAGVGCAASGGFSCPVILAINTTLQEALVVAQAGYNPNFTVSDAEFDQAGIFTSDALGALGTLAAANSGLSEFASKFALGLAVGGPQFVLDITEEANAASCKV